MATETIEVSEVSRKASGSGVKVWLALLSVYLIWGSTYLAIRLAIEGGFPPFLGAGIRFIIAGAILYIISRAQGIPSPTAVQWRASTIVGALLLLGGNGGVSFAEANGITSGLAAVWIATMPLWAALFAGLWGRWPTRLEWVGLGVGLVGVGLLNFEKNLQANPLGAAALLASTICWALGSVWSRRLSLPRGLMASGAEMLAGGVLLIALSQLLGEKFIAMPTEQAWWALGYLVVFGSLVAYSAYIYLLGNVRPAMATSYAYVNPMVAVGLGVVLGGEHVTAVGLVAMAIILGAVGLVVMGRDRATPKVS